MPANKHSFEALKAYLPEGSFDLVMPLIIHHKVHLTISRQRQTKLGDYRNAYGSKNHRISVNGNLNKYSFLITLLHELAHLLAYEQFGNRIQPHGAEWKRTYGMVLKDFLGKHLFPPDIAKELQATIHNPAASSCAEDGLQRILNRYDTRRPGVKMVEQLITGQQFKIPGGRVFVKGEVIRKRIKCFELPAMKPYLFSPLYEVMEL
ncbi:MAG: SprT-like domain-containing protein [Bacteroidota bacterium]